jgi:p-aminobenzoyl-glutamate transporter AbgT
MMMGIIGLILWAWPADSALRGPDMVNPEVQSLVSFRAPLMQAIVPLIFVLLLIPGVVYGYVSGKYKSSKDMIDNMTKSMESMGYYIVMAFFCALFIDAFSKSNIGLLVALKGANFLQALALPGQVTIVGIILLSAFVNLLVGSASAKWALIAPIFVPMLMQLGISPDLTQAAYRVGDSVSNIITPLLPYFPLVVVFCQRYVKNTGIGTLISMMLPYALIFLVTWTIFLLVYWAIGIPLSFEAYYTYPAGG